MQLARANRDWRMQSAIDGLFTRVPTAHAVIPVNEKPDSGRRKDIGRPAAWDVRKQRAEP
jgi:hypothetical protein